MTVWPGGSCRTTITGRIGGNSWDDCRKRSRKRSSRTLSEECWPNGKRDMNGRHKKNRFRSKTQGMNQRKHRWVCLDCDQEWTEKQRFCPFCGSRQNQYFSSRLEYGRFRQLQLEQTAGLISNLRLQPAFPCIINGSKITTYRADFQYLDKDGETVVEDCKGLETDVFRLKKSMVEALHRITIKLVTRI